MYPTYLGKKTKTPWCNSVKLLSIWAPLASMAISPSLYSTSSSLSPLLFPKIHHSFLFPFSQPHLTIRKFDRYTFLTVGSRQNLHLSLRPCAVNLNSQTIKAEASVNREPMVPPYNVLITGSTKGLVLGF